MTDINLGLTSETIQAMKSAADSVNNTIVSAAHSGLAADVLFITALNNSVIPTVVGGIIAVLSYRRMKKVNIEHDIDNEISALLGYILLCFAFILSIIAIIITVSNVWAWVGLFRPDIYAAHLAISIVTK